MKYTAADDAKLIQAALLEGDRGSALRLLSEAAADFDAAIDAGAESEFLSEEPEISFANWDTLFRTMIAWKATERSSAAPAWTAAAALEEPMFLWAESDITDGLAKLIRSRTPSIFASRNIWTDAPRDLSTA